MVNIENYVKQFTNSEPIVYTLRKGGDIKISPVCLGDYFDYQDIVSMFSYDKNSYNNIEFIRMSYLEFLSFLYASSDDLRPIINNGLLLFSKLCLGYNKITFGVDNDKICLVLCDDNNIVERVISPKEFNDIKTIVLNQNNSEYRNEELSEDMKKIVEDYYRIKYQNINVPSLEQKKAFVSSKIGKTFNELNSIPIREFELVYQSCVDNELYIAQKIIQASFKYDIKEDIQFPLYEKKKDPFEEILSGKQDLAIFDGIDGIGKNLN